MADWKNNGPFRFMNFKENVPDSLRFPLYILFLIAFQFSNGFYFSTMAQLSGERALTSEDTEFLGCAVLTGCAFFFPLAFRLKFCFTNKTSLTMAASGMAIVNVLFPHVDSMPILTILAYIGGFCRLYGTFEVFSNILPKITPTYNYGVFLSFVFFIVIGCVQMFDWVAIKIIYYFDWQHVHLLAIGLCLCVIFLVRTTMQHFRPQPKAPLYGIDWLGMIVWTVFILSAIFVTIYGERFDWLSNPKIRIGIGISLIALSIGLVKMKIDDNAFIQSGVFKCPNIWGLLLLFLCFDILLATQTVLQNTFTSGVLGWGQESSSNLKIFEFLGGLVAAIFFWLTRTYLHWRLKLHAFISMGVMVLYCLIMTHLIYPSLSFQQMYLPSFVIGFAHVAIFISLTVYAQAYCNFKYYFQVLCILGFIRMGLGDAVGATIWKHALAVHVKLQHLSFLGSLRELYGWAVVFGVVVIIAILCSTFDRLRNPYPTMKQAYIIITKLISKMKKSAILLLLVMMTISAQAQTNYTIEDLFNLAEQNSKSIRLANDALSMAKESSQNARMQRLPDVSASISVGYNGRGLITDRDFSNSMSIYIPEFGNNFTLKATQVLYAGGAIKSGIAISEQAATMAELDVQKNRQEVRFYIVGQYLDLCRTLNTLQVVENNLALTDTLIINVKSKVEQGIALANDITRHELQREQLQLQLTRLKDAYSIINYNLSLTVGLPEDTQIVPAADFDMIQDSIDWRSNINLKQTELLSEMAATSLKIARSSRLPKVAIVAEDNFTGPITIEIPAINKNFNYWFIGLGVQYDLSSIWKNRHEINRAQFAQTEADDRQTLVEEQISTAINATKTELHTAEEEFNTCEKQVNLALENYDIVFARYKNDIALLTDMLDAAQMRLSAEIALVQSKINILYCKKKLEYLSSKL